jgi:hypothetical protein
MARSPICRPIFILGVDRSGTSMVAELIHRWGAYGGEPNFHGSPNTHNPQGYFEYIPMQALLTDAALSTALPEWDPGFRPALAQRAHEPAFRSRALALAAQMEEPGRPWYWKEPFLCFHLDFWDRILQLQPVCVATVRNPQDSARSFAKMTLPEELRKVRLTAYFCLRWQHFMLAVLDYFERNSSSIYVRYEDLLSSPVEQVRRLCGFLDRELAVDEGGDERFEKMIETINPALWRNKSESSFFELPETLPAQHELLRYLHRRAADRQEPYDSSRYPLPPYAREYLDNFSTFMGYTQNLAGPTAEREQRRRRLVPVEV